jgi:predicted nucleic acid-binding protein
MKCVFEEDGSALADDLWNRAETVYSSQLVYPEARAAAAAANRAGRIDAARLRSAVEEIEALCDELAVLGVDAGLARDAGELAERHALRGFDAVHLAAALSIGDPGVLVATWDRALGDAAARLGRLVVPR